MGRRATIASKQAECVSRRATTLVARASLEAMCMQWSNLFAPAGLPLSQIPSNFWSILARMTLVFALSIPKNTFDC